ncbi:LysR substrate-binding domain-containing protein [Dickeya fangzhongdai]|nr:LysR substrate-binding domain-containing protein [Dickeya fangzhongdai]WKV50979.1 LysR substrate-binding domain-containing protein [Dickeya fangzhongdai]
MTNGTDNVVVFVHSPYNATKLGIIYKIPHRAMTADKQNRRILRIDPAGPITVNDGELMRSLAVKGVGLIYSSTFHTSRELAMGTLEPALLDSSPGNDGLFLYFSKAGRNQPKLRAFIDICSRTMNI